jgi:hypothetical protein
VALERTTLRIPGDAQQAMIRDADIDAAGNTVVAFGQDRIERLIFSSGATCEVPAELRSWRVRLFSPDSALVLGGRVQTDHEINAWLVDARGTVVRAFAVGDGAESLFRTENFLVATYWDEGVFGSTPQGQEGLAVFDLNGQLLWGWNNTIASNQIAGIVDCYSATALVGDRVAVFSYRTFQLGMLDLRNRVATARDTPKELHGARMAIKDETAYFAEPYNARETIYEWSPHGGVPMIAGQLASDAHAYIRGLDDAKFLEVRETEAIVLSLSRSPIGPSPSVSV